MTKLLEQAAGSMGANQDDNWTLLQALGVLYAYPTIAAVSRQTGEKYLSPWAVKSAVEICAMQLSLHRSVEDLDTLMKSGEPDISTSFAYRHTFYWLWLFVKSRHHSVITRTPPSIPNDSTITTTLDLLLKMNPQPGVWRVMAEAALDHMWDEAARSNKGLAEWWCLPSDAEDIGTVLELLQNAENMLQEWSSTWLQSHDISTPSSLSFSLEDPSVFAHSITSFMGILTRFSIVSFAATIVSRRLAKTGLSAFPSTTAQSPELSAFLSCVLRSADAASQCCDLVINLKPAAREVLRYTPDYGFTMIALCCLHLIYAYNMSPDNMTLRSYLSKAERAAHLLIDLRVGSNICPQIYGEYVLFQLRRLNQGSVTPGDNGNEQSISDVHHDRSIAHQDSQFWSQLGFMASSSQPPLDSLFRVGLTNQSWPVEDMSSDGLIPSNSDLLDIFNAYPDSVLHSNINPS